MIIKTSPDKEKAKSMLNLIKSRESFIISVESEQFSTIIAENYYEIIKELASALLLLDGLKSTGENAHKDLIDYLSNYRFNGEEIYLMNDLRIKRNKSSYEGKQIEADYIKNKKDKLFKIIKKLKDLISQKI